MGDKRTRIPPTPSIPTMTARLRLMKENSKTAQPQTPDAYYEQRLLQEVIRRSYIQYHPTSGYHKVTNEIRAFYDGFELHNRHDDLSPLSPVKPIDDDNIRPATMRQLMTISYDYGTEFYDYMRQQGFNAIEMRRLNYEESRRREYQRTLLHPIRDYSTTMVDYRNNTTELLREWYRRQALMVQLPHENQVCYRRLSQLVPTKPSIRLSSTWTTTWTTSLPSGHTHYYKVATRIHGRTTRYAKQKGRLVQPTRIGQSTPNTWRPKSTTNTTQHQDWRAHGGSNDLQAEAHEHH
eukprot:6492703-Amphidinium_carterae.3